ncbi:MAG: hypothetical protein EXS10_08385 [Phycisphaerales bacterium]|nr:hypothetical protein [Phycisphaerales bacterium]
MSTHQLRADDPPTAMESRTSSIAARESKEAERIVIGCDSGDVTVEVDATMDGTKVEASFHLVARDAADLEKRRATTRLFATRSADGSIIVEPILVDGMRAGERVDIVVRTFAAADTSIRAKSGAMKATGVAGKLRMRGANGAVLVRRCSGQIDIHSSRGAIDVFDAVLDVHIASQHAPVSLRYADDADAEFKIETTNGPVTVSVGPLYDGVATLRTTTGGIVLRDSGKRMRTPRLGDTVAQIELGAGVAQSVVETSNGTVIFEARASVPVEPSGSPPRP